MLSLNVCEVSRVISEHLHHPKFAQGKVTCRKQYFRASITTRQQAKVVIITKGIQKFSFMFACCASICYIFIFIFKSFIIHTLHHHMCHDYHTIRTENHKMLNFESTERFLTTTMMECPNVKFGQQGNSCFYLSLIPFTPIIYYEKFINQAISV